MNTRLILSNLKEAEEELRSLIAKLDTPQEVPFEGFHVLVPVQIPSSA
jgi:hypothetical protein